MSHATELGRRKACGDHAAPEIFQKQVIAVLQQLWVVALRLLSRCPIDTPLCAIWVPLLRSGSLVQKSEVVPIGPLRAQLCLLRQEQAEYRSAKIICWHHMHLGRSCPGKTT